MCCCCSSSDARWCAAASLTCVSAQADDAQEPAHLSLASFVMQSVAPMPPNEHGTLYSLSSKVLYCTKTRQAPYPHLWLFPPQRQSPPPHTAH